METKTYLLKHEYDFKNKKMKNVSGARITLQFKIMDSCTMLEIIGYKSAHPIEEFKHQILAHKEQDIMILPPVNDQIDQVELEKNPINSNVDRVHFNQSFDPTSTFGLHGQLELFQDLN